MTRRVQFASVLFLFAAAAVVAVMASPRATLTLRNGDRVQTELVDLGGSGFTIRSPKGTETLGTDDVAFIDFAGSAIPAAELKLMQDGGPFIAMRNGDIVNGRLIDIGGTDPLRLTVRTSNGNQDYTSNEVARVFLSKWNGMPTSAAQGGQGQGQAQTRGQGQSQRQGQAQGQTVTISATECWVQTGIIVRAGDQVAFAATGEIQLSGDSNDVATVSGSKIGRTARVAPIPESLLGALIGRIDNRQPFGIGNQTQLSMPASGELWVGINDYPCQDNRGEFRVRIDNRR